ncbi:MAG TPA: BatA domain-containing protein, partial [Anaeromyxobacteraceae bacterium]|nr:BatA domain-containing protein [Anaeromyxobacteraceae bacterium]
MRLDLANPALVWGLLLALLPLAIHLFFRRRPKPLPFPALDFLLRARRETERRLKLRRILLFAA